MSNRLENKFSDGETLDAADLNDTFEASPPVGTIIPWHKDFANTPVLPAGWAECNGQTLSNPDSPYDSQTLPDLNGEQRFIRGNSTSGGTGGLRSNSWSWDNESLAESAEVQIALNPTIDGQQVDPGDLNPSANVENQPPYMDMVFIMKVA